jgi:uncharacterized protein
MNFKRLWAAVKIKVKMMLGQKIIEDPVPFKQPGIHDADLDEARRIAYARALNSLRQPQNELVKFDYKPVPPPPGVVPSNKKLAMDEATPAWAVENSLFEEGLAFLGYPYLAQLSQRPEYRVITETWAQEMTRKWIRLVSTGDGDAKDKSDKLIKIEAEFKRLKVQDAFKRVAELDGFFGRGHIYFDFGNDISNDREELETSIGEGGSISKAKITKGSLKSLRVIEPIWTYPSSYNANDPFKPDFFKPSRWFVMGKEVHSTRLLTFIGRPMPDLLKPAYSFGGLSLSQMAKPYVDNWLRNRQSVSDAVGNFSIMMLMLDMSQLLNTGAAVDLAARVDLFNVTRDNRGVMVADKDKEDLKNVSMPLGGLDHLQAQSQEHMASVSQIPLVKLLGITPSGLNASSEGEIKVFYDKVNAQQVVLFNDNLTMILNVVQLSLFGEIDPEIGFVWEPLDTLDASAEATRRKTEADTDCALIDHGVISPEEARIRLASDDMSPYASLNLDEESLPEAPGAEEPGQETDEQGNPLMSAGGGDADQGGKSQGLDSAVSLLMALDKFEEAAHPRGQPGNPGQFAPSAGGGKTKEPAAKTPGNVEFSALVKMALKDHGFSIKKKPDGTKVFAHPNGTEISVGPAKEGAGKYTSMWVSNKEGKKEVTGSGPSKLKDFLANALRSDAGTKTEAKPVEAKPVESKSDTPKDFEKALKDFKFNDTTKTDKNEIKSFKKGDSVVELVTEGPNKDMWAISSPGHMTKMGLGATHLQKLLDGDKAVLKQLSNYASEPAKKVIMSILNKSPQSEKISNQHDEAKKVYKTLKVGRHAPTTEQENAIVHYTSSAYAKINEALRHNPSLTTSSATIKNLTEYLDKASLPADAVLSRKVKGDYAKILRSVLAKGTIFVDHGFSSMSTSFDVWSGEMKMIITCPKGSKAAAVGDLGSHPGEKEVIAQRGSRFKVTSFDRSKDEVHLELLPPEEKQ